MSVRSDPFPVRIGVDDIATGTQKCDGWTYFCLPEVYAADFARDAKHLLDSSGLDAFHGKDFKVEHVDIYREFLIIIRRFLDMSLQTFAINVLLSAEFKAQLQQFADHLIPRVLIEADITDPEAISILSPYGPPLFTLARIADGLALKSEMQVELDEHDQLRDLDQYLQKTDGSPVPAHVILKGLYNGYAKKRFLKTPLLPDYGVRVMPDTDSFLIQAADVVGNFSMAFIFKTLGRSSYRTEARAGLIEEVFGQRFKFPDFKSKLTLSEKDIHLNDGAGELRFSIRWYRSDVSSPK